MNFLNGWTIDNYLSLILLIGMAIGSIFALIQWNSSIRIRRTEFLDEIINKLWFDQSMAKTMYNIDNDPAWYTGDFHKNYSDMGYQIDKLLSYFDFICYLYEIKNIKYDEFNVIKYEIDRACASPSVQAYLWNLYHFSNEIEAGCSFMYIINYGIKEKIIKNDFKSNNKDLFNKYLKF
ncbi:MAG: hypothetical protein FWB83_01700 [Treponema sp.]|nr:hypothetical protein [Treponema sp.]